MRLILLLGSYNKIKLSEMNNVKKLILELESLINKDFEITFPDEIQNNTSKFILLGHQVKAVTSTVIVKKMNVKPKVLLSFEKGVGYTCTNSWEPKSLLGCMYAMLYNDLFLGYRTAPCDVCGNPVVLRDKRSKPYHTDCQGRKHTANTRERQTNEAKKYIVRKYTNKPDVSEDEIFNKERDYIYEEIGKSALFNKKRIHEWLKRK